MMKVYPKNKSRILKRLCSFALGILLCVSMFTLPFPTHAVKSTALPDTLTSEMATAYANHLMTYQGKQGEYGSTYYAVIETLGSGKYPVLRIIEDMEMAVSESIWLFTGGKLENVYNNTANGGRYDDGKFFVSVIDGIDYYGFYHYNGDYNYDNREIRVYTVESGQWKTKIQFEGKWVSDIDSESGEMKNIIANFFATEEGNEESISETEYNQYLSKYVGGSNFGSCKNVCGSYLAGNLDSWGVSSKSELLTPYSLALLLQSSGSSNIPVASNNHDNPLDLLTPEMAKAYGEKLEEALWAYDGIFCASIEIVEGRPVLRIVVQRYPDTEEEIWAYRSGGLMRISLSYSLGEIPQEIPWEEIERAAKLAAQLNWIGLNITSYAQFNDVLSSIDAEQIKNAEDRISLVAHHYNENYEFDSTQLDNNYLASLVPTEMMSLEHTSTNMNDGEYVLVEVPCQDIQVQMMRLFGRTIDFTPYTLDHIPTPNEWDWFNLFIYNDTAYFMSDVYYWGGSLDATILGMYDIGNGIFIAPTYIVESDDNGDLWLFGSYISVFRQSEKEYQLLKVYALDTFPSVEEINRYAIKTNPESNFKVDYSMAANYTDLSQYVEALKSALSAVDTLNDAGNRAVTDYIDYVIQDHAPAAIYANENTVVISPETVKAAQEPAQEAKAALLDALDGLTLFRAPDLTARIDISGLDLSKPVRVRVPQDAVGAINELDHVTMVLGDSQHMVTIPVDGLRQMGYLDLQLEKIAQDQYSISFFDQSDNVIEHLEFNVAFTLPASSELSSVQAVCAGYSDNWGGQYDSQNKTITFQTPYTGEYTILTSTIDIPDIDYLSDEMQQAITFMVSKGYFELDSEGRFNPSVGLNRYEFTQSLIKIFFALNLDAVTSFDDVTQDNLYYSYVASGEENEILAGYDDGLFHGDDDILRVQMLAICGRTLVNKKNYSRPGDPTTYLNYVDSADIPGWAAGDLALTVREGLIESGSALRPNQPINRGEAALLLYRLFMLLYDVSPTPITVIEAPSAPVPNEVTGSISPAVIGGIVVVGIGAVGGAAYYILGKKKDISKKL